MKRILCIVLLTTGLVNAKTQIITPVKENYLEFKGGLQKRVLLDKQKSALIYSTTQATAGLEFGRFTPKYFIGVSLNAGIGNYSPLNIEDRWLFITTYDIHGTPATDSFPVLSRIISGAFQLTYQKKLNPEAKLIWLAGASVKDFLLYPDNYIGLLNSLGVYLKVGVIQNLKSGRLRSNISFPVLAVNSRLPWHNTATSPMDSEIRTFFRKGSRLVSLDKFIMIEFDLKYDYRITKNWSIGVSYEFGWFNIPYYQPLKSYINTLQIQTSIQL